MNKIKISTFILIPLISILSSSAFSLEKIQPKSKLTVPDEPIAKRKESGFLEHESSIHSPTDGLSTPQIRAGPNSKREDWGKAKGVVNGRHFTAWFSKDHSAENGYDNIVWTDTGDSDVVDMDTYHSLYESFTDEAEGKRNAEEAERVLREAEERALEAEKEAEEDAEKDAEEDAEEEDCDESGDDCGEVSVDDETTIGESEDPDGDDATVDDVLLSDNGGDTTGGINQGDDPEPSGEGATFQRIVPAGAQIQDFPTKVVIDIKHIKTIDIIGDSTGGGPIIVQEK